MPVKPQNVYVPSDFSAGGYDLAVYGDNGEFDATIVNNLSDV